MNKLEEIIQFTRTRVTQAKSNVPTSQLEDSMYFQRSTFSLKEALGRLDKHGVIAEFKRQSPSKGPININASIYSVAKGYESAGASALSILTEPQFFLGNNMDIALVRTGVDLPILRKDFIVNEYQIIESKAIGADVILLIASVLSKTELRNFTDFAHQLKMEVLVEIRDKEEIENLPSNADIVGVNNRNLKTFNEGIEQSILLSESIPKQFIRISESSINHAETIIELKKHGYQGFLIGEHFMRHQNPETACEEMIMQLEKL